MTARRKLAPGLYEDLVDGELARELAKLEAESKKIETDLEPERAAEAFARYLYLHSRSVLGRLGDVEEQRALVDELLARLGLDSMVAPTSKLLAIADPERPPLAGNAFPPRPLVPLDESDLLVNARGQANLGQSLLAELPSTDGVDLVCSFIRRTGLARLQPALRELCERRPGRLRVLTTTYTGVTEGEALARLADLGAEIKVDYGGQSTRLHAKTWVLHRRSGLSTAYVGSSNISHAALVDGREWNVRLSARENPD
ncbi:MAG: DUF3427 domain-containing protein, partial [Myxococcales bacterium]|nr:DUF3427 domain-containing protein [Myxococcales bacterium]